MLEEVIQIIRQSTQTSPFRGKLFLVGGYIRDRILHIPPDQDVDIVCLADALSVAEFLNDEGLTDHGPVIYPRFGTAMVSIRGINVELATARRESYDPDSRKPANVEPASLEEDVSRRDFTVNTLLEDLHTGEKLDLTRLGMLDIQDRLIRTPLDPDVTFKDDPLRMLRAVRFAAKLDFRIHTDTYEAILRQVERLEIISRERIRDELSKTLLGPRASHGLDLMLETGLLQQFAPELAEMKGVTQNVFHLYDVWTHTMKALDNLPTQSGLVERLGLLFHDIGKPETRTEDEGGVHFYGHQNVGAEMTRDVLQRLKYPNDVIDQVVRIVSLHMRIGEYSDEWSDSAVRRLVRDLGDQMDELFMISEADKAACNPEYHYLDSSVVRSRIDKVQEEADYAHIQSPLDGREIMEIAGINPGPDVGRYKEYLVNEILEGRLSPEDREEAKNLLLKLLEQERGG